MSTSLSLPSSTSVHRVVWAAALTIAGLASANAADSQNGSIQKNITTASTTVATIMHWWSWVAHVPPSPRPPTSSHVTRTTINSIPIGFRDDSWALQEVENPIPIFHFTQWSDETLTVDMTDFLALATLATNNNTIALKKIKQEKLITFIEKYTRWFPVDPKWKRNIFMYCTPDCARLMNEILPKEQINWLNFLPHWEYPKDVRPNDYAAIGKNMLIISPKNLWPEKAISELKESYWKDINWTVLIPFSVVLFSMWAAVWVWWLNIYLDRRREKEEKENNNAEVEHDRIKRLTEKNKQKGESTPVITLGTSWDKNSDPSTTHSIKPTIIRETHQEIVDSVIELLRWTWCQEILQTQDDKDIVIEFIHRESVRFIKITPNLKTFKKDSDNMTFHAFTLQELEFYLKHNSNTSNH